MGHSTWSTSETCTSYGDFFMPGFYGNSKGRFKDNTHRVNSFSTRGWPSASLSSLGLAKAFTREKRFQSVTITYAKMFQQTDRFALDFSCLFVIDGSKRVGPQGTLPIQRCSIPKPLTRSGEATRVQTAIASEFFVHPTGMVEQEVQ